MSKTGTPRTALRAVWLVLGTTGLVLAGSLLPCHAQELEPRRWGHLPKNTNFAGAGYVYTTGETLFDPVLLIEDVELEMHSGAIKYIRTFELFDKLARVDLLQGYQSARWSGLLNGVPTTTTRTGMSDTVLRFSMNLFGSPPLEGEDFVAYRNSIGEHETIVGAGVAVHLPTGHYLQDRLLNLGANRVTTRPQLGVVHNWGKWSWEVTGSTWFFTDNDDFWNGNRLEQDPLYAIQGHVVYSFKPGLWISTGAAYGYGNQSTLNGVRKDDEKANAGWGISMGYPITPKFGVKIGYVGLRTRELVGSDLDSYVVGFSLLW